MDLCADTSGSVQIRASQSDLSIANSSPRLESNATTSTAAVDRRKPLSPSVRPLKRSLKLPPDALNNSLNDGALMSPSKSLELSGSEKMMSGRVFHRNGYGRRSELLTPETQASGRYDDEYDDGQMNKMQKRVKIDNDEALISPSKSQDRRSDNVPVRRDLSTDLLCPLCDQLFDRPVTVTCGHSYCEPCIEGYTRNTRNCVICNQDVGPLEAMIPSITLDNMARKLKNQKNIETRYDDVEKGVRSARRQTGQDSTTSTAAHFQINHRKPLSPSVRPLKSSLKLPPDALNYSLNDGALMSPSKSLDLSGSEKMMSGSVFHRNGYGRRSERFTSATQASGRYDDEYDDGRMNETLKSAKFDETDGKIKRNSFLRRSLNAIRSKASTRRSTFAVSNITSEIPEEDDNVELLSKKKSNDEPDIAIKRNSFDEKYDDGQVGKSEDIIGLIWSSSREVCEHYLNQISSRLTKAGIIRQDKLVREMIRDVHELDVIIRNVILDRLNLELDVTSLLATNGTFSESSSNSQLLNFANFLLNGCFGASSLFSSEQVDTMILASSKQSLLNFLTLQTAEQLKGEMEKRLRTNRGLGLHTELYNIGTLISYAEKFKSVASLNAIRSKASTRRSTFAVSIITSEIPEEDDNVELLSKKKSNDEPDIACHTPPTKNEEREVVVASVVHVEKGTEDCR